MIKIPDKCWNRIMLLLFYMEQQQLGTFTGTCRVTQTYTDGLVSLLEQISWLRTVFSGTFNTI